MTHPKGAERHVVMNDGAASLCQPLDELDDRHSRRRLGCGLPRQVNSVENKTSALPPLCSLASDWLGNTYFHKRFSANKCKRVTVCGKPYVQMYITICITPLVSSSINTNECHLCSGPIFPA